MSKLGKVLYLSFVLLFIICFAYFFSTRDKVLISAIERNESCNETIILESGVPLSGTTETDLSGSILKEINSYRVANGLNELTWSTELKDCAAVRAEEITVLWSHTRPDGSDWYTVNENIMWGENLAKGNGSANAIVTAWKNSPSHNENLLNASFKYVGISVNSGYIACEFCY